MSERAEAEPIAVKPVLSRRDKRVERWLETVRIYLDKHEVAYACGGGIHATLWDNMMERYDNHSGPIYDLMQAEIEHQFEESKKGGERRDEFETWCNFCKDCARGKDPNDADHEEEYRREYAQETVDHNFECFYSSKSKKKSQYMIPQQLDHIEDIDDDIGVAMEIGYAAPTKQQQAALKRLKDRDKDDWKRYTLYQNYYVAQNLLDKLQLIRNGEVTQEVPTAVGTCPRCFYALPVGTEKSRAATTFESIECPHCRDTTTPRAVSLMTRYLFDKNRFDYEAVLDDEISDLYPPFPLEEPFQSVQVIARVKPCRSMPELAIAMHEWEDYVDGIEEFGHQKAMLFYLELPYADDAVSAAVFSLPTSCLSLARFMTGEITLGHVFKLNSHFVRECTEVDINYAKCSVEALLGRRPKPVPVEDQKCLTTTSI